MPGLDPNKYSVECYDVSNIRGKYATESMIVFSAQGGPASGWIADRSQYKKFKIRLGDTRQKNQK